MLYVPYDSSIDESEGLCRVCGIDRREFYSVFEQVENILADHTIEDIKTQYQNMPHNLSGLNSTGSNHYYNITTLTLPEDVKISRQGGNFQYMDPSKREVLYMWPKICALKISS